jgi:hypothetical protein
MVEVTSKSKTERSPAFGGSGGYQFDSGCNHSGVTSISLECGFKYPNEFRVKRVYLGFRNSSNEVNPSFYHLDPTDKSSATNREFTFKLDADDTIVKVVVWSHGTYVNAIQVHTAYGNVSPLFGTHNESAKSVEFKGQAGEQLVGMYGKYGGVIDSVGFSFGSRDSIPGTIDTGDPRAPSTFPDCSDSFDHL